MRSFIYKPSSLGNPHAGKIYAMDSFSSPRLSFNKARD